MSLSQQHADLVADFLARGGRIRKLGTPAPTFAEEVLRYLQEGRVNVRALVEPGKPVSTYIYKQRVITEKQLVAIANRRRARRRLLPFELTSGSTHS